MLIVCDTREQAPLDFSPFGATVERSGLATGDYSVKGLEHLVAVERKSLPDLVGSLTRERERFERELQRGAGLRLFGVVVEGTMTELVHGQYRSRANPHAMLQSVAAMSVRYRCPFWFVDTPELAAYLVHSLFSKFIREAEKVSKAILAATAAGLPGAAA